MDTSGFYAGFVMAPSAYVEMRLKNYVRIGYAMQDSAHTALWIDKLRTRNYVVSECA